jgi:hypothetical protein
MLQFEEARTSEDTSHHLVTPSIFETLSLPHQSPDMGSLPSTCGEGSTHAGLIATPPWSGRAEA